MTPSTPAWLRQSASLSAKPQESDGLNKAFFISLASDEQLVELLGFEHSSTPAFPTHRSAVSLMPPTTTSKSEAIISHPKDKSHIWEESLMDLHLRDERVVKAANQSSPSHPHHQPSQRKVNNSVPEYKTASIERDKAVSKKGSVLEKDEGKEICPRRTSRPSRSNPARVVNQQDRSKMHKCSNATTHASLRESEAPVLTINNLSATREKGSYNITTDAIRPAACDYVERSEVSVSHQRVLNNHKQMQQRTRTRCHPPISSVASPDILPQKGEKICSPAEEQPSTLMKEKKGLLEERDGRGDDEARLTPSTDVSSLPLKSPQESRRPISLSKVKLANCVNGQVECFNETLSKPARHSLTTTPSLESLPSKQHERGSNQNVICSRHSRVVDTASKRCQLSPFGDGSLTNATRLHASAILPTDNKTPSSTAPVFTHSTNPPHFATANCETPNCMQPPTCSTKTKLLHQQSIHAQGEHLSNNSSKYHLREIPHDSDVRISGCLFEDNCQEEEFFSKRRDLQSPPSVPECTTRTKACRCTTEHKENRCKCKGENKEHSLLKHNNNNNNNGNNNWESTRTYHDFDGSFPLATSTLIRQSVHRHHLQENQEFDSKVPSGSSIFHRFPPEVQREPHGHNGFESSYDTIPFAERFRSRKDPRALRCTCSPNNNSPYSYKEDTCAATVEGDSCSSIISLESEKAAASSTAEDASTASSPPEASERVRLLQRRINLLLCSYTPRVFVKEKLLANSKSNGKEEDADVASVAEGVYSSLARRRTLKKVVIALSRYSSSCRKLRKFSEEIQKMCKMQLGTQLVSLAAKYRLSKVSKEPAVLRLVEVLGRGVRSSLRKGFSALNRTLFQQLPFSEKENISSLSRSDGLFKETRTKAVLQLARLLHKLCVIKSGLCLAHSLTSLRLHATETNWKERFKQICFEEERVFDRWAATTLESHFSEKIKTCFKRWRLWTSRRLRITEKSNLLKRLLSTSARKVWMNWRCLAATSISRKMLHAHARQRQFFGALLLLHFMNEKTKLLLTNAVNHLIAFNLKQKTREASFLSIFVEVSKPLKIQLHAFKIWRQSYLASKQHRVSAARLTHVIQRCMQRTGFHKLWNYARQKNEAYQRSKHLLIQLQLTVHVLSRAYKAQAFAAFKTLLPSHRSQRLCQTMKITAAAACRCLLASGLINLRRCVWESRVSECSEKVKIFERNFQQKEEELCRMTAKCNALAAQRAEANRAIELAAEETLALRLKLQETSAKPGPQNNRGPNNPPRLFVDEFPDCGANLTTETNAQLHPFLHEDQEALSFVKLQEASVERNRLLSHAGEHMFRNYQVNTAFADRLETAVEAFLCLLKPAISSNNEVGVPLTFQTKPQSVNLAGIDKLDENMKPRTHLPRPPSHLQQHKVCGKAQAARLQRQLMLCHAQAFLKQRQLQALKKEFQEQIKIVGKTQKNPNFVDAQVRIALERRDSTVRYSWAP